MELSARYLDQLRALLPPGAAWRAEAAGSLRRVLEGLAIEAARVHDRALDLLAEMDPSTATELLHEWETVWGLPDPCTGALTTLAERRAALTARIAAIGHQTPGYFVRLAARLGYAITVEENVEGDPTVWRVNAPETTVRWARAGSAVAGDAIRSWGNQLLECAILMVNPAHLTLLFGYAAATGGITDEAGAESITDEAGTPVTDESGS